MLLLGVDLNKQPRGWFMAAHDAGGRARARDISGLAVGYDSEFEFSPSRRRLAIYVANRGALRIFEQTAGDWHASLELPLPNHQAFGVGEWADEDTLMAYVSYPGAIHGSPLWLHVWRFCQLVIDVDSRTMYQIHDDDYPPLRLFRADDTTPSN